MPHGDREGPDKRSWMYKTGHKGPMSGHQQGDCRRKKYDTT
jgi:hypothetical protein